MAAIVEHNKYNSSHIYKIQSSLTDKIYIGSTCQALSQRMAGHMKDYKIYLKDNTKRYISSYEIIKLGDACQKRNLWQVYKRLSPDAQKSEKVITVLKQNDINVNINWPLAHYKSAVHYLNKDSADIAATGGTNWQKYLPPRFQKRIFYPALWSKKEIEEWGKEWVEDALK